jgi:hypothetical protein
MVRVSAVLAVALTCSACVSTVDPRPVLAQKWLGRWAVDIRQCDDPEGWPLDLVIAPTALSFGNERGAIHAAYPTQGALLVVVADDSGMARQYRSYDLSISPSEDAVSVVVGTETAALLRCPNP